MNYCSSCGSKLEKGSNFCIECGAAIASKKQKDTGSKESPAASNSTNVPLLTLEPEFVSRLTYLRSIPVVIFVGLFISFFTGPLFTGIVGFLLSLFVGGTGYFLAGLLYVGLLVVGIPKLFHWNAKRTYAETEYRIYDDKVEYSEGFLNVSNNTARLDRITDIHLKQGYFQQKYGLGTLVMDMPGGGSRNSIKISDIKESDKIYKQLQELLDKS